MAFFNNPPTAGKSLLVNNENIDLIKGWFDSEVHIRSLDGVIWGIRKVDWKAGIVYLANPDNPERQLSIDECALEFEPTSVVETDVTPEELAALAQEKLQSEELANSIHALSEEGEFPIDGPLNYTDPIRPQTSNLTLQTTPVVQMIRDAMSKSQPTEKTIKLALPDISAIKTALTVLLPEEQVNANLKVAVESYLDDAKKAILEAILAAE